MGAPELSSVHDALRDAQLAEADRVILVNLNTKVHPLKKSAAESICEAHGITVSAYVRSCIDRLVLDYGGPKLAAKLEQG